MCFGCSKEPSHQDSSFEYPQHMFWLRNTKNNFQLRTATGGLSIILRKKNLKIDKLEELLKARACQSSEHFIIGPQREKTCLRGFRPGLT